MASEKPADRSRRGTDISKLVGTLPPETLKALGLLPPLVPIQAQLGRQVAAIVVSSSPTQAIIRQLMSSDAMAFAARAAADTSGDQRIVAQHIGTDRFSAAFGQTLLVQHRIAEMTGSAAMGQIAANAATFLDKTGFHQRYLPELHSLGLRMSQQMGWLTEHRQLALSEPVLRVNRAWQSAASGTRLLGAPETVLDFGRSALAINRAAFTIETQETPSGEIWYVARATDAESDEQDSGQIDQLLGWLESVDQKLPRKYKGAWNAIGQRGPDWISQGANSGIELLDWTLRMLAPDEEVIAWQQGTGKYATEISERDGKPHRSLRCRYIAHSRGLPARALEDLIAGASKANRILQKLKHADDDTMAEALRSSMIGLEYCLMIMWRGA